MFWNLNMHLQLSATWGNDYFIIQVQFWNFQKQPFENAVTYYLLSTEPLQEAINFTQRRAKYSFGEYRFKHQTQ